MQQRARQRRQNWTPPASTLPSSVGGAEGREIMYLNPRGSAHNSGSTRPPPSSSQRKPSYRPNNNDNNGKLVRDEARGPAVLDRSMGNSERLQGMEEVGALKRRTSLSRADHQARPLEDESNHEDQPATLLTQLQQRVEMRSNRMAQQQQQYEEEGYWSHSQCGSQKAPSVGEPRLDQRNIAGRGGAGGSHGGSRRRSQSQGHGHHHHRSGQGPRVPRVSSSSHPGSYFRSPTKGSTAATAAAFAFASRDAAAAAAAPATASRNTARSTNKKRDGNSKSGGKGFGLGGRLKGRYERKTARKGKRNGARDGNGDAAMAGVNPFFGGARAPSTGANGAGRRHRGAVSDAPARHRPAGTSRRHVSSANTAKCDGGVHKLAMWVTGAHSRGSSERRKCHPAKGDPNTYSYSNPAKDYPGGGGGGEHRSASVPAARRRGKSAAGLDTCTTDCEADDESERKPAQRKKSWTGVSLRNFFACWNDSGTCGGDCGDKIAKSIAAATTIKRRTRPVGPASPACGRQATREKGRRAESLKRRSGSTTTYAVGSRARSGGSARGSSGSVTSSSRHDSYRGLLPFMPKNRRSSAATLAPVSSAGGSSTAKKKKNTKNNTAAPVPAPRAGVGYAGGGVGGGSGRPRSLRTGGYAVDRTTHSTNNMSAALNGVENGRGRGRRSRRAGDDDDDERHRHASSSSRQRSSSRSRSQSQSRSRSYSSVHVDDEWRRGVGRGGYYSSGGGVVRIGGHDDERRRSSVRSSSRQADRHTLEEGPENHRERRASRGRAYSSGGGGGGVVRADDDDERRRSSGRSGRHQSPSRARGSAVDRTAETQQQAPSMAAILNGLQTRRGRSRGRNGGNSGGVVRVGDGDEQQQQPGSESELRKPPRAVSSVFRPSVAASSMAFSTASTAVAASPWSSWSSSIAPAAVMAAAAAAGADSGNTNGGLDVAAAAASAAALWRAAGSGLGSPSSLMESIKSLKAVPEYNKEMPPSSPSGGHRQRAPRSGWRGAGPRR